MSFQDVRVKQEVAPAAEPPPCLQRQFSAAVTTGQGGLYAQNRSGGVGTGQTVSRLGNNRAPIPTCGIAVTLAAPNITMSGPVVKREQPPASVRLSETMLEEPKEGFPLLLPSRACESTESTKERAVLLPAPTEDYSLWHSADLESELTSDEEGLEATGQDSVGGSQLDSTAVPKGARKGKEKKKVGRPLAYKGDPNAPELTEQERRRVKRRIANRESARRVRHKRQEVLEEMHVKMENLHAHNLQLVRHAQDVEAQKSQLCKHLSDLEESHEETVADNQKMQQEILALKQSLQMKMSALDDELDKRVRAADETIPATEYDESASRLACRLPNPPSMGTLIDTSVGMDLCKAPLEWFPSLNIDEGPTARGEAWDVLSSFLRDDTTQQQQPASQHHTESVC